MLVPKLRFKREDGSDYPEWSSKSFANAFAPLNNNTFSRDMLSENGTVLNIHYGDILVKFGEVCDIQAMDIPKVNAEIDTSKYDELQDGDIILADTAEDETVGKAIEIYHTGTSKVVSGLHTMACRPNDKYAPKYMGYYINSPTYHNQLLPFMQGIKVTSIGRKNIADTVIYYPADLEEQQKIADFLSTVDEVITQSEAEVQNLEQQKKAAMQKIFSQEVRFKREDGSDYPEWKELTMNEIFTEIIEKNRPDLPVLSILQGQGTVYRDSSDRNIMYDKKSTVNYKAMKKGDFIIHLRTFEGGLECATLDGISSPAYKILRTDRIIPEAYKAYFRSKQFIEGRLAIAVTGVRDGKNIEMSTFWQILVPVACLEEQQKIADFLSAYDEAISYAKQELEHWKQLKKGLLQQMFV